MEHNLFSKFGAAPLEYPHYTKWDDIKGEVLIVTHLGRLISEGDTVMVAMGNEEVGFTYFHKPAIVSEIKETRPAMGEHNKNFKSIFQRLSILPPTY